MSTERIPKGLAFGRLAKSIAMGRDSPMAALAFAEGQGRNWADTPGVRLA